MVEHLFFEVDATGFYGIEVEYAGSHWDFGAAETGEFYGLSWSGVATAVPEPGSAGLIGLAVVSGLLCRRKR